MIHSSTLTSFVQFKQESIRLEKQSLDEIITQHEDTRVKEFTQILSQLQADLESKEIDTSYASPTFNDFLDEIGYEGKGITELSQNEAAELVGEDGFFGIKQTSERIADFVILGANGDSDLLKAGREGILQGFNEAEKLWGGKLPQIAYDTIHKSVEMIDTALAEAGASVIDTRA